MASLGQRLAATILDLAFGLVAGLVTSVVGLGGLAAVGYLALMAYGEGRTGQSPGKYVAGIRVLDCDDGRPIGVGAAVWRTMCRAIGGYLLMAGWAVALFNPGRRAAHDFLAKSVVITCPPSRKSVNAYVEQLRDAS